MVVDGSRLAHATHTVRRVDWIARLCTVWLITDIAVAHAEKKRRRGQHRKTAVARIALKNLATAPPLRVGEKGSTEYMKEVSIVPGATKE